MKMKMKNDVYHSVYSASPADHLNAKTLRILVLVPEFQKDIQAIRAKFNIVPPNNFRDWLDACMYIDKWFQERGFRPIIMNEVDDPKILGQQAADPFIEEVKYIGKKFNLPYNLYNEDRWGLRYYILTDRIGTPSHNWEIEQSILGKDRPRWFTLRIFQPLSDKEIREANSELKKLQGRWFTERRARIKEFEDKFPLIEELLSTSIKPAMAVNKESGLDYASLVKKHGEKITRDQKAARKAEQLDRKSVTEYDRISISEIAKKAGLDPNDLSVFKKAINKLAISTFGYGIDP